MDMIEVIWLTFVFIGVLVASFALIMFAVSGWRVIKLLRRRGDA